MPAPRSTPRRPETDLLLGPRFVLLRREFAAWREWRREVAPRADRFLVTLGGADPDNVTGTVVRTLADLAAHDPSLHAEVLAGSSFPFTRELEAIMSDTGGRLRLLANITDMPARMAEADLAIAAGGTTTWERAFMGLPSLTVILAENQVPLAEQSAAQGFAVNLGWGTNLHGGHLALAVQSLREDRDLRQRMAERGRATVDGRGAERVVRRMLAELLTVRLATPDDARLIWEWANDATTRAVSFSSAAIPWEDHVRWLNNKLADPKCLLLIAVDHNGTSVGMARCDLDGSRGVISVNLAPVARGRGLGTQLIRRACNAVWARSPVNPWMPSSNPITKLLY